MAANTPPALQIDNKMKQPLQNNTFVTERLQLAIYFHATGRLRFIGCEPIGSGKVRFCFEDTKAEGPQAELDFERGAMVPATALFASQKFLRRAMSVILDNRKIGETPNGRSR